MKQRLLRLLSILSCILPTLLITTGAAASETQNLEDRIERLEAAMEKRTQASKWFERIQLSGIVEIEAGVVNVKSDEEDIDEGITNDIDLASADLAVNAQIADHVDGHVLTKYDGDTVYVDEGFVTLHGADQLPAYLIAGKQYIPFGNFDSHFISDPTTLTLGETAEGALIAGYRIADDLINISAGVFNSEVQEEDVDEDDVINSFVAAVQIQPIEALSLGASYTSNIAGSNEFQDIVLEYMDNEAVDQLDTLVGGWSVFVSYRFLERFKFIAEYVGTLDEIQFTGDLDEAGTFDNAQPSAWNTELGMNLLANLEVAVRYGGSEDGGADFIPESQYGAVLNWGIFNNTILALEYLHSEYEADAQKINAVTAQLAVEY